MTSNLKRKEESHQLNGGVKQPTWSKAFNSTAVWEEKVSPVPFENEAQLFYPVSARCPKVLSAANVCSGVHEGGYLELAAMLRINVVWVSCHSERNTVNYPGGLGFVNR